MTTLSTSFLLHLACLNCFRVLQVVQGQAGETTWLMSTSLTPSIAGSVAAASTPAPPSPASLSTDTVRITANVPNTADYSVSSSTKVTGIISDTSATTLAAAGASPAGATGVSSATAAITAFLSASQNAATNTAVTSTADAATASTSAGATIASSYLSATPGSASSGTSVLSTNLTQFATASLLTANGSSSTYADGKSDGTVSNPWQPSLGSSAPTSRLSSDTTLAGQQPLTSTPAASNTTAGGNSNGAAGSTVTEGTPSLWWLSLLVLSFVAVMATLIAIAAVYRRIQKQRFRLMSESYLDSAWKQNGTERLRPGPAIKTTITFENATYEDEGESRF